MPVALSVNLNKIALLRNSREGNYPSVVKHGQYCLELGVQGLTAHPRPDQRHIRPHDIHDLAHLLEHYPGKEFNIEGNPFAPAQKEYPGLMALVEQTKPEQCTLVPDTNSQLTSDHGFNLNNDSEKLKPIIAQLKQLGVRISLFMDPDLEQIALAKALGVERIELYTGPYALKCLQTPERCAEYALPYKEACEFANRLGLGVNAGHDLNLHNLSDFVKIPGLLEVSIGHALTVDALKLGFEKAVQAYLNVCQTT